MQEKKSGASVTDAAGDASKGTDPKIEPAASSSSNAEKAKEKEPLSLQDAIRLDAFNVLELLGPEKVFPKDVKLLKEQVHMSSTHSRH
jgi:hypothetical protein